MPGKEPIQSAVVPAQNQPQAPTHTKVLVVTVVVESGVHLAGVYCAPGETFTYPEPGVREAIARGLLEVVS